MADKYLKKNPDEVGRSVRAQHYTKSLEGGPPNTEYARDAKKTTGPTQVIPGKKAPRNKS